MSKTRKIVYIGFFISLSIVLTRLLSFYALPTVRVGFGDIPIMLSGILLGPLYGALTGALSDIIGMFMFSSPAGYFPGFTLSKLLVGLIPGLAAKYLKGSQFLKIAIGIIAVEIICSLTLDTLWLSILYHKGIIVLLPPRIIVRLIITAAEIPAIYAIVLSSKKALNFNEL